VYQKLSGVTHLWIDAGPHVLGDIVDFVFAGAEKITIRLGLYRFLDIDGIRKITECELYLFIDDTVDEKVFGAFGVSELDGSVVTEEMYRQKRDFQYQGFLKRLRDKHQIFILSSDARHTLPYGFSEVAGQILPIEHLKGVESSDL
jgi:hypothetical protein